MPYYLYPGDEGNKVVYRTVERKSVTKNDIYQLLQEKRILEQFGYYEDETLPWKFVEPLIDVFIRQIQAIHAGRNGDDVLDAIIADHYEACAREIETLLS